MRFAIVFAALLAVAVAASQQEVSDGDAADNTVVAVDDVIDGADYTLGALVNSKVTGLSDRSINGVSGVALTNDGFLVGLPSSVQATLFGMFDGIVAGFDFSDDTYFLFDHVLCFTGNWVNQLSNLHTDASIALGDVECETDKPIPERYHQTADGNYITLEYFNYLVCYLRQELTTAKSVFNTITSHLTKNLDCTPFFIDSISTV